MVENSRTWFPTNSEQSSSVFFQPLITRKNIIQKVPIVSRHAYSFWSEIFFPFSFFGAFCACRFLIFLVSNICFRRTTHFLPQSDMTRRPCEGLRAKQTCDSFSHASRPKHMFTKVETMENNSRVLEREKTPAHGFQQTQSNPQVSSSNLWRQKKAVSERSRTCIPQASNTAIATCLHPTVTLCRGK